EMMDQSCIRAVEDSVYAAGYPRDAAAVLLAELDGAHEAAVAADGATIEAVLRAHGARSVLVAADAQQRERLWLGRKKAFGAMGLGKLRYMPLLFDGDSLAAMRAVRRVWDPEERVNPGKVVPIHACREWSGVLKS